MQVGLIVIDGQVDFCEGGKLGVLGGNNAMIKVASMIDRIGDKLDTIDLTLDAHHKHHIAHACMWIDENGNYPSNYTTIKEEDVTSTKYKAAFKDFQDIQKQYIVDLKKRNDMREKIGLPRIEHTIWPEHCLIGSVGMSLHADLFDAVLAWEDKKRRPANKTTKGSFLFSENFSVFKAEVPNNLDMATYTNHFLISKLARLDILAWTGLAKDYCLMNSFIDYILEQAGTNKEIAMEIASKMVFIKDGTASVGVMPELEQKFNEFLRAFNVRIETTDSFMK